MDARRLHQELQELSDELDALEYVGSDFDLWLEKTITVLPEALGDSNDALVMRFVNLQWCPCSGSQPRIDLTRICAGTLTFESARAEAQNILKMAVWKTDRQMATIEPFNERAIDPELWEYVRRLVEHEGDRPVGA
jgi:hypothetical protein